MRQILKIIPKPKIKTPFFINFLFWFSLILTLVLITLFLLLKIQIINLETKKERIEKSLEFSLSEKKLIEEITLISENINLFIEIFQEHRFTSKFLNFLKTLSHFQTQFTSLEIDNSALWGTVRGKTKNFQTLSEQILIFQEEKNIENFQILDINLTPEGKVEFNFAFNFSPKLIKKDESSF